MRHFKTGATRDKDTTKPDYEGFIDPLVIRAFGSYMHKHRKQADGSLRDSDNWQKGFGLNVIIKSMWRHFLDLWLYHRGKKITEDGKPHSIHDILGGLMFNVMAYWSEILKKQGDEVERNE